MDGQGTKWHGNISEIFNRLSRAHERYGRRQTDRQTDRRTDGRWHIANMNLSSRSLIKSIMFWLSTLSRTLNNATLVTRDIVVSSTEPTDAGVYLCAERRPGVADILDSGSAQLVVLGDFYVIFWPHVQRSEAQPLLSRSLSVCLSYSLSHTLND